MYLWIIAIVLLIIAVVITVMISSAKQQQQQQQAPTLKEFKFPIPDEGSPQIVTFGDVWTPNWQVLWVGNYRTETIYSSAGGGGKK